MNQSTIIPANAYILIGGNSRRFGEPKWKAQINGFTMIEYAWNICSDFKNRFIIGKSKPNEIEYSFINDVLDIQSPLNGLYSALQETDSEWNFMLSCDLPLISKEVISKIWTFGKHSADSIVPMVYNQPQPISAFYNKQIKSKITHQIKSDKLSMQTLLKSINTNYVNMDEYEKEFSNMNTKDDYNRIIQSVNK